MWQCVNGGHCRAVRSREVVDIALSDSPSIRKLGGPSDNGQMRSGGGAVEGERAVSSLAESLSHTTAITKKHTKQLKNCACY